MEHTTSSSAVAALGRGDRHRVLVAVFLGWLFAGVEMALMVPTARPAIQDFIASGRLGSPASGFTRVQIETLADQWFSAYLVAFLLGAACGGILFGWMADRWGRVKAMGWSMVCFSGVTGLSYFTRSPEELLLLRFIACLGIGGMWPCGVALATEAWPDASRPILAGMIGAAANIGFLILGLIMLKNPVTRESWRWVLLLGACPLIPALLVFHWIPESPQWILSRAQTFGQGSTQVSPLRDVFRPPTLRLTILGVFLGTIPLLGGWASGQRLVPWAGQFADLEGLTNLKAWTQTAQAAGAVIGSLGGGWLACALGKRFSYFLISLFSLGLSLAIFLRMTPAHPAFLWACFALGLVSTSFYGWLPYFIPELFPTRIRATGAGISYNLGRVFSAAAILASTALTSVFAGDIGKMGAATSLIYLLGLALAWMIPQRSGD